MNEEFDKQKRNVNKFAKFSSLAFEMLAPILMGALGGRKLDEWQELETPVWTIVLTLLGVTASMYQLWRRTKD
ncbi:AtpZ/AtpI family protein [Sediminitomix flava]|uniref:Putative F0F1-ATPase subunit (Ca2+/Mg2+ transporter) n=1 Tax=Sediminitomix flava TaxID=379075 RepID=A0A315ZI90_SEDFL|nr:AtpZ/AtpI family protein [Sediminitomix flava]PWJ45022.1 putative F0F1-ATPase subunit (Ca2+/Mg2+ transporter) [Sediminitomix flava]